jgi:hypothetical protein
MSEHHVFRTNSTIKWTYVHADKVSDGMRRLADVLDEFDLEGVVTDIKMDIADDGVITVSALTEQVKPSQVKPQPWTGDLEHKVLRMEDC